MRFKTLLLMALITTMLFMSMIVPALNVASSYEKTGRKEESNNHEVTGSIDQDSPDSSTLVQPKEEAKPAGDTIANGGTGKQGFGFFSFDSFVRDVSSHDTDSWANLVSFDEDSAKLVVGVNGQQSDHAKVADLISAKGGKLVNTVTMGGEVVALIGDIPFNAVSSFVSELQASNLVRYVEPNMKFQVDFVPNDPYWSKEQWGPQKIEADYAWNTTKGDPSVLIAVIDTGVDYSHPDIAANYVPLGYDWVNEDSYPMDDHGHGTHVAGIAAAVLNNGEGIAGVAQVRIMAEKGLDAGGWGTEDDLARAIEHAVNQGADILSNSWGGPESFLIHDAIKYAYGKGVLVVAAAGNSASSEKHYPGAYDEVIAVTATDRSDNPAYFTTFGDWVEVAAPGVDIYSAISSTHSPSFNYPYDYLSGTSMSTPHVSGVAALIWSQFPNVTRDWVWAQLLLTADDLGPPGFDKYYGYGRINARKAVEQAPQDHDLVIFNWEKPRSIQPGNQVSFNVTVLNFGKNDEQNATVQLFVAGNLTDSIVIGYFANGTSASVSLLWNPLVEGTFNVTLYVVPVVGETVIENNVVSEMVQVRYARLVLWDDVHDGDGDSLTGNYLSLYELLSQNGFIVDELTTGTITPGILAPYEILVLVDPEYDYQSSEITAIQNWVAAGGALVIIPDSGYPVTLQQILASYGVALTGRGTWYGTTTNIVWHPITEGVNSIYYDLAWELTVTSAAEVLAWSAENYAFLSVTGEEVVVLTDSNIMDNYGLGFADNTQLMLNIFNWIGVQYQHELTVRLDAPSYIEPTNSTLLNATVYNRGLNNETNVQLFLLINGSVVNNATIPELVNGTSYAIDYLWTPTQLGMYNVTVYAPPVPNENVTANNVRSKFVSVQHPLIRPIPGQWAYYEMNYYEGTGQIVGTGSWKLTYDYYVAPYMIFVTLWIKDPSGYNATGWMIVNTMNRLVENGVWMGMWYPGWIETNVTIGSTINLLSGPATINGSRMMPVGIYPIDCWELPLSMYGISYTFWYDKVSGLWIGMDYSYTSSRVELRLVETNIPIGTTYDHELAAILEAPSYLEPTNSTLLNATVYNIGLNSENDVKLSLLIDGTEVQSVTIPTLFNGTSYTLSYLWTPTTEAKYNVTAYVQPVLGEAFTENNAATKMVRVRLIKGHVLFDQTHWTDPIYTYSTWVNNLTDRGYVVDTLTTSPITSSMLKGYDVFIIPQAHFSYSYDEREAIQNFVLNGGGLLVIGDDAPSIYTELTNFVGITWDWSASYAGPTTDITPHPVTEGVDTIYFGGPSCRLFVKFLAEDIVRDWYGNIMLAVAEAGKGAVIGLADDDSVNNYYVYLEDNLRLANNMIDWLKSRRPIASFTYMPQDPYIGETVAFDASASYDPDGKIVGYSWDFGDGDSGNGVTTTHVYETVGTFTVTLLVVDNDGLSTANSTAVKVLRTTLSVQVTVGSEHLRGEMVEIYILVSSLGKPIDAEINATLYYDGAPYESLSSSAAHISLGFYRVIYNVPLEAPLGTYALVVEASHLSLRGISLTSFELYKKLTGRNATLISINSTIATIQADYGSIKVKRNVLNPTIVSIEKGTVTIDSIWGQIQADTTVLKAKLTAFNGNLAAIQTDIGTITTDLENILETIELNMDIATVKTTVGTITGTIVSIENDKPVIKTAIGTLRTEIDGWTCGATKEIFTMSGTVRILVLTTSNLEGQITYRDKAIEISLNSPSDTSGTVNIIIPKSIISDIKSSAQKIIAMIDGERVALLYKEATDTYAVSITYSHSAHTLKVYLAGLPPAAQSSVSLYIIATAIIVLAAIVSTATYMLKIRKPRTS